MKTTVGCPQWCGQDYRCSADSPFGEHRSEPVVLARRGHRFALVVSLVQRADRTYPTAEFRLRVRLRTRTPQGQVAEVTRLLHRLSRLLPGGSRS